MRIRSNLKGTKECKTAYNRLIRFRYMVTEIAKYRFKVLKHWDKYGLESTIDAFDITERTLWYWKQRWEKEKKLEALNPKRRTTIKKRERLWDIRILEEIKRLREVYPNLGAGKIYPLLLDFTDALGIPTCPKKVTIERLIHDRGGLRIYPKKITGTGRIVKVRRHKAPRKPKGFRAEYPGHCIAFDTIEKQRDGKRMYILTAIDLYTRTAFAIGTRSHSSKTTAHFFVLILSLFPYPVHTVLTDNGSEFKKYLTRLLNVRNISRISHTYPRTPKMNAHCERFNRVLQTEYVDYHTNLLFDDITQFNTKLTEYLLFYNTKRVHQAFKNTLTPIEVLLRSEYYVSQLSRECKNGWGQTSVCFFI